MTSRALLSCSFLLAFATMAACAPNPVNVANKEGIVTSVGPVIEDADGAWTVSFSVFDNEGDQVDVRAEFQRGGGAWESLQPCAVSEAPCTVGSLRGLSTRKDYKDEQHQIVVRPGSLSMDSDALRFSALEDRSDAVTWPN